MFKFLDPSGCTYYQDEPPFAYNLPERGQKWSKPTVHPDPAEPDGRACGPGRLHLMNHLDARHAPANWWPWWARGIDRIGGDEEKTAYTAVELRRIDRHVFWRCLRPPFNWGKEANLREANLYRADLSGANLYRANLRGANLYRANLRGADLYRADLYRADLRGADLSEADLRWANLYGANLDGADLRGANLYGAIWSEYTRWPDGFEPPGES